MIAVEITFWFLLVLLLYTYFGYPLLVLLAGFGSETDSAPDDNFLPVVSLIIAAYNEEDIIAEKLKNSLELDYPEEKLEVIVFSDASEDGTDNIVDSFNNEGVRLLRIEGRKGKTYCQNVAVEQAIGEIIVFSDANSIYRQDAVKYLVRNFSDPRVGCVCGELRYHSSESQNSEEGEGLYWKYETWIKKLESRLGSLIGASGSMYAVRKSIYTPLKRDIISDFVEPLAIMMKNYRVVYEENAVCYEVLTSGYRQEFKRKSRIINRSMRGLWIMRSLLNPFKWFLPALQLISHKILRWTAPFSLVGVFFCNMFLISDFIYLILFFSQVLFYLFALIGFILEKKKIKFRVLNIPYFFCIMNLASLFAFAKLISGRKERVWSPVR